MTYRLSLSEQIFGVDTRPVESDDFDSWDEWDRAQDRAAMLMEYR